MFTFDQQSITASTVKYVKLLWTAVLLDDYDRAVVADIGLGKMAADQPTFASGQTPLWASPEQLVVSRACLACLAMATLMHACQLHYNACKKDEWSLVAWNGI